MKSSLPLIVFSCFYFFVSPVYSRAEKPVVIYGANTFDVTGANVARPLRLLAKALQANKNSQTFKVNWFCAPPNGSTTATVIYKRSTRILTFWATDEASGFGYEGFKPIHRSWRLKRVTDAMIIKLARKHQRDHYDPGDSYFSDLAKHGAKRY